MKPILNIFIFIFRQMQSISHRQTTKSTNSTNCTKFERLSTLSTFSIVDTDREGGANLKAVLLQDRAVALPFMGAIQEGGRGEITGSVFTDIDSFRSFLPEQLIKCNGERCLWRIGQVSINYRQSTFNSNCQLMPIWEVPS